MSPKVQFSFVFWCVTGESPSPHISSCPRHVCFGHCLLVIHDVCPVCTVLLVSYAVITVGTSARAKQNCDLCSYSGVLVSYAQQCGRPPIAENRIVGGMDATDGAWPWQVDIHVSPLNRVPIDPHLSVLSLSICVCFSLVLVYQADLLRRGICL